MVIVQTTHHDEELRAAAERSEEGFITRTRRALAEHLRRRRRARVAAELAKYAAAMEGTVADLDPVMERAAVEHFSSEARNQW
ncbi:MAG: hypothetical protein V1750_08005 [Acidobacteriota bacterium]